MMNRRFFLNKKQGVAFMYVAHNPDSHQSRYNEVTCQIGDCDRRVNIDLSFSNPRSQKEKLNKLSNMIEALTELHQSMSDVELDNKRRNDDD